MEKPNESLPVPKVVIVGAGFGGLAAAKQLAGKQTDVLVVDRNNYHCFQPLLYQVATAALEPEDIAHPVRGVLRQAHNVRFEMAKVESIYFANREVITPTGRIPYDYLVLAGGSTSNFFGLSDLAEHAYGLKDLHDAVVLRNHLLTCFESAALTSDGQQRQALLTFVVVGGGPTGVELAGALEELIHLALTRDYPDLEPGAARVVLVEGEGYVLPGLAPSLREWARQHLARKGVEVRLHSMVKGYDGHEVQLDDGSGIPTETVIWAAGVRATEIRGEPVLPVGRNGRIAVSPTLQVLGQPDVYVIGDLAYFEQDGQPLPMVAQVALQQGTHAAANIAGQIAGREPTPFRYHDKGTLSTIGRNAAVAQLGWLHLIGFPAWVVWLTVHLYQLVGFRNRLLVFMNWAWSYLFADRAVRLIVDCSSDHRVRPETPADIGRDHVQPVKEA